MATAAGWFPDPEDPAQVRYWDGQAWTENRAPAVPPAPPAFGQVPQYPTPPYGSEPYGYLPPSAAVNNSNTLSIIGIVCGAIALLFCPPLLGTAGLVLGAIAKSKNEPLAPWALGVSAVGLVGGILIGILVFSSGIGY